MYSLAMPVEIRDPSEVRFKLFQADSAAERYAFELVESGEASEDLITDLIDHEDSSVVIRDIERNRELEYLVDLQEYAFEELRKTERWFMSFLIPGNKEKREFWSKEVDRLSLEIYELMHPSNIKDEIDELMDRAEESYKNEFANIILSQ